MSYHMITPAQQLDKRFATLGPFTKFLGPSRGWIRAIREALGMTTAQLAKRIGVSQPRVVEMEKAEVGGNITVDSLQRAADALGCRLVYVLVPFKPLTTTLEERAEVIIQRQLAAVEQTMRLEAQEVRDSKQRKTTYQRRLAELLRRPARLWDD